MNAGSELQFDGLCRTCMHEVAEADGSVELVELAAEHQWQSNFNMITEFETLRIIELLATTMPQLQIKVNDKLPQTICRECFDQLVGVFRFQRKCMQSNQHMRDLLAKNHINQKRHTPGSGAFSTKQLAMQETNLLLEVPLASVNDPLQSGGETKGKVDAHSSVCSYLKIDYSEEDVHETMFIEPDAADASIKIEREALTITTARNNDDLSNNVDADIDWVNDGIVKLCDKKAKNCNQANMNEKVKAKKAAIARKEQIQEASPTHTCNLCSKSFSSHRLLQKHKGRHKKVDEQKMLPLSNAHNGSFGCVAHHEKAVAADRKYGCDICDNKFTSQRSLTRHKRLRHCTEGVTKLYICKFCNKNFQQAGTLKDHIRIHTGEQPYLCSECGKAFKSASNLRQHLLRHTGVKRYECPDCPKKFTCLSDLASHKAVHGQTKPNICDICGRAFGKPYLLKKHKMYHNGEKPYKCEYCEMRFVCMDHQRRHMRTHTGEKPYKCKYCERAFAQSNDLIKHLRIHLGENVYKCELCPRGFRLATELRVHFALHKNDDEETRARNMQALGEEEAKLHLNLTTKKGLVPSMVVQVGQLIAAE